MNIAEGSSRTSRADIGWFIQIAASSVFEVISQFSISTRRGFVGEHDYGQVYAAADKESRMLSDLRKALEGAQ